MKLTCIESYKIAGRGSVLVVENPHECDDFSHLIGHNHWVDGKLYHITGVESQGFIQPFPAGRPIGLLVRAMEEPYEIRD